MTRSTTYSSRPRSATALALSLALSFALTDCAATRSTTCSDGKGNELICPASTHCSAENHRCVTDAEESACVDHVDGDPCKLFDADGRCHGGVCVALFCGDGLVSGL